MPGVALDTELRRTRLYNGREPRSLSGADVNGAGGGVDSVNTGAVARPSRVRSQERPTVERGNDGNSATPLYERPARPPRVNPGEGRTTVSPSEDQPSIRENEPEPRRRPVSPARNNEEGGAPTQRPPRREERSEPRPEPKQEPRPEPKQEAPPRREESKPAEQRRERGEDAPARVSKPDNR